MDQATTSPAQAETPFLARHEFLLRRLHSLSGIVPVGAYMVIHLLTNSTINESDATFQRLVNQIHDLPMLVVVEWVFIFIPLLFHALYGVLIIRGGLPNHSTYRYTHNFRYTMQRATGMIAFVFIMWHVFHMHGWIHAEWWEESVTGFGAMFRPYNAASTAVMAMRASVIYPILYVIGVLACVFHFSNGIWTFGITWGLWTTPPAQARALKVCDGFGIVLALIGLSAVWGFASKSDEDIARIRAAEEKTIQHRIDSGEIDPDSPKIWRAHDSTTAADNRQPTTDN